MKLNGIITMTISCECVVVMNFPIVCSVTVTYLASYIHKWLSLFDLKNVFMANRPWTTKIIPYYPFKMMEKYFKRCVWNLVISFGRIVFVKKIRKYAVPFLTIEFYNYSNFLFSIIRCYVKGYFLEYSLIPYWFFIINYRFR